MKTNIVLIVSLIAIAASFLLVNTDSFTNKENFDAVGLVFNKPSEWFNKASYNPNEWIVAYYPQQLEKPECMHYRGNPRELNWLSSAYRFWRM